MTADHARRIAEAAVTRDRALANLHNAVALGASSPHASLGEVQGVVGADERIAGAGDAYAAAEQALGLLVRENDVPVAAGDRASGTVPGSEGATSGQVPAPKDPGKPTA